MEYAAIGKSAPSAPPAPDYVGAAQAQGAANVDAARLSGKLSNPNIYGPLGSQTVTYQDDIPTIRQTLTPAAQQALNAQQHVQLGLSNLAEQGLGTASNALADPFKSNTPDLQTSLDTSGVAKMPVNAGQTGQDAIMSRLAPQIDRMRASDAQTLANQGIPMGSEAWKNAMTDQGQRENDLLLNAAKEGVGLDLTANQQGYNQALQSGQFSNTAIGNELQRQLALRNQPLNEITSLMSGGQIQMPQFQGYSGQTVQPPPTFGAAQAQGQNAMNNYGIASSNVNAANAGMYDLLGTAGMGAFIFSDRRLKSDIRRIGTHPRGFGIFEYTICGRRERGVIAQEVREILPHAVIVHPSGFLMVNYGALDV